MLFSAVLTSADVLLAIMAYAVLAGAEPFLEEWLHRVFAHNPPFQWGWDNFIGPLIRAGMIVAFVLLAYPALFGLSVAPGIGELLAGHELRLNNLLGVMFIATIFLPLFPFFGRRPELVLPLQGVLATAIVFHWLAAYLNVTSAHPWPGTTAAVLILGLAYLSYHAAIVIGSYFGERLDRACATDGLDVVVMHAIQMLVQAPVILIYGYALGRQLAI
jgi:hypothetical protein